MLRASSLIPIALLLFGACEKSGARTQRPDDDRRAAGAAAPELDAAWMRGFLERFATDEMAGRFTLDPAAIDRAAKMIEDEYTALGVQPVGTSYRVPFDFQYGSTKERAHHVWIEAGGPAVAVAPEQIATVSTGSDAAVVGELALVGHGAPPKRKTATPVDPTARIAIALDHAAGATAPLTAEALDELIVRMQSAGMRALVLVDGDTIAPELARARETAADLRGLPVLSLGREAGAALVAKAGSSIEELRKLAAKGPLLRAVPTVRLSVAPRTKPKTEHAANVIAWIPGAVHPDQIVMVGAHYDHIGTTGLGLFCRPGEGGDDVCNGADDNGSGTAMVLAIARAIAKSDSKPQRSLVFVHFAAEELGLHGSRALAAALPKAKPFEAGKIVAMVNFDMVGRLGEAGLSVGGVGSSEAWMPLLDRIGTKGVPTIYERSVSSRSDQASFYELDIPVLFFFTGLHDDYHRADDELAKINYDGMAAIGETALELVVALAAGAELPFHAPEGDEGLVGRMPGSDERSVEKRVGLPEPKPASPPKPAPGQ